MIFLFNFSEVSYFCFQLLLQQRSARKTNKSQGDQFHYKTPSWFLPRLEMARQYAHLYFLAPAGNFKLLYEHIVHPSSKECRNVPTFEETRQKGLQSVQSNCAPMLSMLNALATPRPRQPDKIMPDGARQKIAGSIWFPGPKI